QSLRELGIHQTLALLPVARADAGCAHRNPHLPGTWMRIGELDDLQDFRAPELAETGCLHHSLDLKDCQIPCPSARVGGDRMFPSRSRGVTLLRSTRGDPP